MILKRIHKLTIISFLGPFAVTFFVCLFILLMHFLFKHIEHLVGKGIEWYIIAELLTYATASLVPLALPLAILLSSLMAFGNLAERYELIALKTAGISLLRVMKPLFVVVIFLSGLALYFSNVIIPHANLKSGALLYDLRQHRPALDIQDGVFYHGLDNFSLRVGHNDDQNNMLYDVMIYDHSARRGNNIVILADSGQMTVSDDERWLKLTLFHGIRYEEMDAKRESKRTFPHNRLKFNSYAIQIDLSGFQLDRTDESLFRNHHQMMNLEQLQFRIDSMQKQQIARINLTKEFVKKSFRLYTDTAFHLLEARPLPDSVFNIIDIIPANRQTNLYTRATHHARTVHHDIRMYSDDIAHLNDRIYRFGVEWHRKFTLSFACILLFFIGAPLGAIIRKGGLGMPAVISVLLFVGFHIISISFEKLARQMVISPMVGMWAPIVILLPVGAFLTYKANKDSKVFDINAYRKFAAALFSFKSGKKPKS